MSNKILKGTFWLTGAAFISKFLGMIYIIPFNELVGPKGGALYYYAYSPYTILISISTIGIPMAISKMVSKYNSLGQYETGLRIFKASLLLMFCTGITAFLILFFSAEWLAERFVYGDNKYNNKVEDVKRVIQMVSFALILIPGMSIVRGYFQGNQKMEPTAISQVVEQIVRIAFVLISAFIIVKIYDGSIPLAVSFATFAAFIGALASCFVLFIAWRKRDELISFEQIKAPRKLPYLSTKELFKELLSYAGPFVLVGITIPLYQLVDSFTFNRAMILSGNGEIAELSLSAITFYGHKLIIIPVTLATGLSLTIVPALTESFTKQNRQKLIQEIHQSLQIVLFFVIPAVVGLMTLSYEAYGALYGMENLSLTGHLLRWYSPVALFFALYTVSAAILQGINEQRFTLISLTAGFLVKVIFNSMFIHMFAGVGSIIVTGLAIGIATMLNLWRIQRAIHFSYIKTFKRTLFMIIFSIVMCIVIYGIKYLFGFFLPYDESRFAATVMLLIGVTIGAFVYLWLTYKSTLMDYVLGSTNLLDRFRRRKRAH